MIRMMNARYVALTVFVILPLVAVAGGKGGGGGTPAQNTDTSVWLQQDSAGVRMWSSVAVSSSGLSVVASASNGYIYTSTDGGRTWTERTSSGNRVWADVASSADGQKLAAAVSGGYIYTSSDGGATWAERAGVGSNTWLSINTSSDGTRIITGHATTLRVSQDGGATWVSRSPSLAAGYQSQNCYWSTDVYICEDSGYVSAETITAFSSSADGLKIVLTTSRGTVYVSSDGGATWPMIGYTPFGQGFTDMVSSADGLVVVGATSGAGGPSGGGTNGSGGYISKSTNGGSTWTYLPSFQTANWSDFAISSDGSVFFASVNGGYLNTSFGSGAQYTHPGSQTWVTIASSADGSRLAAAAQNGSVWTKGMGDNAAPTVSTLSGPAEGVINTTYTYTYTATDPEDNNIRYAVDWDGDDSVDEYAPSSGYTASGTEGQKTHSWPSVGTYTFKVRTEDEGGMTSSWASYTVTISNPAPVVLLTASSNTYHDGVDDPITLTWSSSYATTCTGTNFSTGGATAGTATVTPTQTTTYTLTCTGSGGTTADAETITYVPPVCNPVYSCTNLTTQHSSCPAPTGTDTACATGYACSAGACVGLDAASASFGSESYKDGHLHAYPTILRAGDTSTLFWNVVNTEDGTCTVTGNGEVFATSSSGTNGQQTAPITTKTTYTLRCTGLSGVIFIEEATINTTPTWMEL